MKRNEGMERGTHVWRENMALAHVQRVRDRLFTQAQREAQADPSRYEPRHTFLEREDELLPMHLEGCPEAHPAPLVPYTHTLDGKLKRREVPREVA